MKRAYSLLTIKSVDEQTRTIKGIATTPATDRMGDVVEPKGAQFNLPIPLLWQHDSHQPIGHVTTAKVTSDGIEVDAVLARIDEPGTLKDRLDEAWQSLKAGLVQGLSIGFNAIETERIKDTMGLRFIKWVWLELSAVTIPANHEATIQTVKSLDAQQRAASGQSLPSVVRLNPPGVSGSTKPEERPRRAKQMKTVAEQMSALEEKRAASVAAQQKALQKSIEADETADAEDAEAFDTLQVEIETIDKQLVRLRQLEKTMAVTAKPVVQVEDADTASQIRGGGVVTFKTEPKLPPGIGFARVARCKALASKMFRDPASIAEELYGPNSIVVGALKSPVLGGSTVSGNWAAFLVGAETSVFADFAEYLRPMTILGKFGTGGIPSLRHVPFRVALLSQTAGGAGYWVGEGKAKPLTSITGERTTLTPLKVATICVLTEEVIRDSSPKADVIIRDELARALMARLDTDFIDPAKAIDAGISPASITHGASDAASSGPDEEDVRLDVRTLMQVFIDANNPPSTGVWIMSTSNALALNMMVNPLGQPSFPGITMSGGTFFGLPIISSEYADDNVVLANASDIYLGDEGGVSVAMSTEASLEMAAPTTHNSTTPTAASLVSMFQTNSVAIRAERTIDWKLRRASGVALLTDVAWGGSVTI